MIVKPENMDFSAQRFSMIIYGSPGVGKSTLALSAPNPVLIDFDRGISRVKAEHRKDTMVCETFEDVLADISSPEMSAYETVIIDTGGSFITLLKDYAVRQGFSTKSGDISLKGFGEVAKQFDSFTNTIKVVMNKNIIYVFHSNESADKDGNPLQRLVCEGKVKNTVWTPCDFGGYVQMIGDRRFICFTPEQEFFAKGCHGINGKYEIPVLKPGDKNNFVTNLFDAAKANIKAENDGFKKIREDYEKVMVNVNEILDAVETAEDLTHAFEVLPNLPHVLTSKKEASAMLRDKAKAMNCTYDKKNKCYVSNEEPAE